MATTLTERIARSITGGTFELETFVRLVGVEETTAIDTAAVTCGARSRLRINPDFVAEHCQRDEHLHLLVMHELWHVLLGHTTAFDDITAERNIAFDAVINAGLTRQHPEPAYRGFFEALNPADVFPNLLLRPPAGWPDAPRYRVPGPVGTEHILRRLYPGPWDGKVPEPTYGELTDLLARGRKDSPPAGGDPAVPPVLLGGHQGGAEGLDPMGDPLLADVLGEVTSSWPRPPGTRHDSRVVVESWTQPRPVARPARVAFAGVLRRALTPDASGGAQRRPVTEHVAVGQSPVLARHDRLGHARRALGLPALLHDQRLPARERPPEPPHAALVYLDVSGSMAAVLPYLIDLLVPLARRRLIRVQQFSTTVAALTPDDLAQGRLTTTHGTDIACVLADAATRRHQRIILLTDGVVGTSPAPLVGPLLERGVQFFAVLPADASGRHDLPYAQVTVLPELS